MINTTRLFDFIHKQKANHPLGNTLNFKEGNTWKPYSTDYIIETANKASRGLIKLGVQAGDKIAMVTYTNRPEWVIMDIAIQQIGAINVPVYPTISVGEYEYIFNEAEVKYCFCGKDDLVDKVMGAKEKLTSLKDVFAFDNNKAVQSWTSIFDDEGQDEVEKRMAAVKTEDMATIIYTSGTTGNPKGVMLSHKNIIANVTALKPLWPIGPESRVLSFLPICHIFERTAIYTYIDNCFTVYFTSVDTLGGDEGAIKDVKPHFFTSVPRLLEKVYEKIYNKGLELTGVKKNLFFWALKQADNYNYQYNPTGLAGLKFKIADKLIYSKWREALGGHVKGIVTGAAPCPVKMARIFSAAGIPIREAYGLTESAPGISVNYFNSKQALLGSVGIPLDNVEVRIIEEEAYGPGEGEILAAGENIMMGYYKQPEKTADVILEEDGKRWLKTGDIGTLLDGPGGNKYLKITDRKKELLKTSGGKYVAPAPIESKLKEDFLVEQIMVVGESKKFVSAVILPAEEALKDWCEHKGMTWTNMEEMLKTDAVIDKYQRIVDAFNPNFSKIEQIKKFTLIDDSWEPIKPDGAEGELTPTMKLKRRVIRGKYKAHIDAMYSE
jgi:long-chain acyl-CoA synthetase